MTTVTILGTGPVGMFAAKACENFGIRWQCLGRDVPVIRGPVFLHEPIFGDSPMRMTTMRLVGTAEGYAAAKGSAGKKTSADFYGLRRGGIFIPSYDPDYNMQAFWRQHREKFARIELIPGEVENMERLGGLINTLPHPRIFTASTRIAVAPAEEGLLDNLIEYVGRPDSMVVRWGVMWDYLFFEFSPRWLETEEAGLVNLLVEFMRSYPHMATPNFAQELKFVQVRDVLNTPLREEEVSTPKFLRVGRFSTLDNRALAHEAYKQTWEWLVKYYG